MIRRPTPPSPDNLNNVEAVHLAQPLPGDYLVRVRARHVVQDARLDTAAIDQDFALVDLRRSRAPRRGLDPARSRRPIPRPASSRLSVFDPARAASNTVSVLVKSTTEPAGETFTLACRPAATAHSRARSRPSSVPPPRMASWRFTTATPSKPTMLTAPATKRIATAAADLVPPVFSGVAVTIDLGVITISWQTSEPANSIVRYGTNLTFNLAATNSALTTSHSVRLSQLVPGQTYSFYVVSADAAGNATTNNNSGAYFSFVGVATPTVLLVDAYEPVEWLPRHSRQHLHQCPGRRRLQLRSLESLRARLAPTLRPASLPGGHLAGD